LFTFKKCKFVIDIFLTIK